MFDAQMDSAATAASLDADDYLQCDIDSLCGATLLSIRSDVRQNPYADGYDMFIPTATHWEAEMHTDATEWHWVMEKELGDLKRMGVYEDIDALPEGKKAIGCRWVYEFKIDESGGPPIYKTCLVAQSFSQVPFMDYGATFAPEVTVRFGAVYSALQGWDLQCFDTTCTFLWDLAIVIFMRRPPPLPPGLCRLVMWIHQEMCIESLLAKHDFTSGHFLQVQCGSSYALTILFGTSSSPLHRCSSCSTPSQGHGIFSFALWRAEI
jgi:ribosomal protein S27E